MKKGMFALGLFLVIVGLLSFVMFPIIMSMLNSYIANMAQNLASVVPNNQGQLDLGMGQIDSMMGIINQLFSSISWGVLFIGIGLTIYGAVGKSNKSQKKIQQDSEALEILKKKYINGEITKEMFQSLKHDISE